ncbi:MAG: hypothetical protein LUD16_00110 [Lachnospiraceae bacterium]|nr:hypothetical protein [Lachnospiraceae bacterium]
MIEKKNPEASMGYINNRRNSFKRQSEGHLPPYREPFLCAEEIEGKESEGRETEDRKSEEMKPAENKSIEEKHGQMEFSSIIPVDFSNPTEEMQTERDFRALQSMYPNIAKELLPFIEEECDRMEYEGSAMFDEYPDFTTVYTLQKKIAAAVRGRVTAGKKDGAADRHLDSDKSAITNTKENGNAAEEADDVCVPLEDLIRVMVLQEMHRRRGRYRSYRDKR